MDYSEEMLRLQDENKEHEAVLEKSQLKRKADEHQPQRGVKRARGPRLCHQTGKQVMREKDERGLPHNGYSHYHGAEAYKGEKTVWVAWADELGHKRKKKEGDLGV